jgi:hypothetical protein
MEEIMANLFKSVVKEKCPYCGEGDVFVKKPLFSFPIMLKQCSSCHRKFDGELGYFFGAMYVSYGFAVAVGVALFVITRLILGIESLPLIIAIIICGIVLISFKNYKWSRIIWLRIFPPTH